MNFVERKYGADKKHMHGSTKLGTYSYICGCYSKKIVFSKYKHKLQSVSIEGNFFIWQDRLIVMQDTLTLVENVSYIFFQRIYTSCMYTRTERKEMLWVNELSWEYESEKYSHIYEGYAGFKAQKIIIKMSNSMHNILLYV
jgi:hypothetical protein